MRAAPESETGFHRFSPGYGCSKHPRHRRESSGTKTRSNERYGPNRKTGVIRNDVREMGDEGEPDSVRLCSCHARDLEETALQSLVKRTGAANCRQVGTTRWELYYSRRPISAINAERRTLSLLMSCISRERTRFPLVSAQGQPNLFLPMRLRHQIVGDT